jgi:hypothetical protein
MILDGPGVQAPGGAEDEQLKILLDLDDQGFTADVDAFAPGPGLFFGCVGGLVMDVTVGDGVVVEEAGDLLEKRDLHGERKELEMKELEVEDFKF